jgi:hypothetical protein
MYSNIYNNNRFYLTGNIETDIKKWVIYYKKVKDLYNK